MRVINQGGYIHENITRLRLEEGCRHRGRKWTFSRILGYDKDKGSEIVLDWGTDPQQVRDCIAKMKKRMAAGGRAAWNCIAYGLIKETEG